MNHCTWKYLRFGLAAVGVVVALISCNSHRLMYEEPSVVVFNAPDGGFVPPPPPPPPKPEPGEDAGIIHVFPPVDEPDAAVADAIPPNKDTQETLVCPDGWVRVHVRDLWSSAVDPTMNTMKDPPLGVVVIDPSGGYNTYAARMDSSTDIDGKPPCTFYSVCIPKTATKIQLQPIGPDGCPAKDSSGSFDISKVNQSKEFWIEYTGASSGLKTDYTSFPTVPTGDGKFHLTDDKGELIKAKACAIGFPPDAKVPSGYTKVHFRWPWSDPNKTGYPGSGCGDQKLGFSPPPYPSSVKVTGFNAACQMSAMLEYQDGVCPWYYMMVPNDSWPTTGKGPTIVFRYPDESKGLYSPNITLPARTANEYWIAYTGAPDNTSASAAPCMDWSLQSNTYFIYTQDPGPGCAGSSVAVDPCSPPQPTGYHSVHFRYIWAGQKTFTFFPKPEFMPRWIEMEVNGPGGGAGGAGAMLKVICYREQDRPWFNCPIPDNYFVAGATWRAVDKTHNPEWNTVKAHPMPTTAKEYWLRWYYGKPDIPRDADPPNFMFFDYYPDGSNGDWSATGAWNDDACAPKPPANPVSIGFGNGAWFPYGRTKYAYPYGGSLAYLYPTANIPTVQDLFNAFVWERYQLWKKNWVRDDNACGPGTAHVWSDNPVGTVSEGQGYGMAITAAIGDKEMFNKLWLFARHYLSQATKKYCGGLMGWMWGGAGDCRPLDKPCDPDTEGCGGNGDSAFDGDVDIAIGLVFAAMQWPNDYQQFAIDWLVKMECEINTKFDGVWNYPTKGDTEGRVCQNYPREPCSYAKGLANIVFMDYYPPGYFRVFGDFLAAKLGADKKAANGQTHHDFWYKTAETVYQMYEMCYDAPGVSPALVGATGTVDAPCSSPSAGTYEELRYLWRVGIDAAWFGDNKSLPENAPGSSSHYPAKSRMQAKLDLIQDFFNNFYKKNPVSTNANRFSSICDRLNGSGAATACDPANGHNSYTVNMAMSAYVSLFDDGKATTSAIRQEAVEEAISTTVQNDHYFQESLGVYSILFLTGNFPNPLVAAAAK